VGRKARFWWVQTGVDPPAGRDRVDLENAVLTVWNWRVARLLIVDDHPIVRRGLRSLIEEIPGHAVVGETGDLAEAMDLVLALQPEVVIVDPRLKTGSGLELLALCRERCPATASVVLTTQREESYFVAAVESGAAAYVLKDNASHEIQIAIQAVSVGGFFLSSSLRSFLLPKGQRARAPGSKLDLLTPSERRILRLIGANRTTKEIAQELRISPRTVDSHRARIGEQLGLRGAQSLLRFALENRSKL
jgi:two-component system, NarL family, nitrate/nitrite response regulator NarL